MNTDELKERLGTLIPDATFEEGGEFLNVMVEPGMLKQTATLLRNTPGLDFDYLFCLTCVDWKTHMTMVYHFNSTIHRHHLVLKSKVDRSNPKIETVCDIWRTAEFLEREVFDLFGVVFDKHPDLRRLFLTPEWEGFPLRKDYEDPINMIKL